MAQQRGKAGSPSPKSKPAKKRSPRKKTEETPPTVGAAPTVEDQPDALVITCGSDDGGKPVTTVTPIGSIKITEAEFWIKVALRDTRNAFQLPEG